jgi:hypothetical protein
MVKTQRESFFENMVIIAIVLVVIQTFLEDFSVLADWPWRVRRFLLVLGFCFDLFFTVEFLTRLYLAAVNKQAAEYFFHERGWIDFLASVPLILLNSGPVVLGLLFGGIPVAAFGAGLNILKIVKAVRIARILRLLRFLKIFRQIKHADSIMAQRHITKITGITITTFVTALLLFNLVQGFVGLKTPDVLLLESSSALTLRLASVGGAERQEAAAELAGIDGGLLLVKEKGKPLYSRFDNLYFLRHFGPYDYGFEKSGDLEVYYDLRPLNRQQSRENLSYFVIILALLAVFLFYYSPHFAMTVTDPLHVMNRGFSESGYNLEAKVPKRFRDDDVYRLAEKYNTEYLPLKDRRPHDADAPALEMKMEDFADLLKKD